ncbi:30S ribosomal protein S18 [Candidatus Peregrinibacteria bacterium]|jgi:small subunit ribosomal protein S18|nr:30S ribosomal protein S18 [Candidatus Peregrinibacteria bacterium]MBT3598721.1 30S ribosomal protein S18 [Candidatus Peregrinibacteria bacterium]MBT4366865.1 30S ribosomal protein S18 [Candidatus Peregrinibacteria bacterium]MBT4585747.1 30S ribosomal protein S18 [Candidatus Peregrinibacteria bacterium]MBT6731269.1 30S ribosomal protein S18 [Candidatus Peregrinibacteria bacterium]
MKKERRTDPRSKKCPFCDKGVKYIDWKDYPTLKTYTDYFGNIMKRYYSGVCLKHQKMLKNSIERSRFMGMLAYRK